MSTAEDLAHSIRKLVSREHQIGLNHIALAVDPFRLYRVEPRTLLGQKAGHYAHSTPALPDLSVVGGDPFLDELGLVPGGIVPDQHQSFLAQLFELLAAPREELRAYGAHRAAIYEPQPGPFQEGTGGGGTGLHRGGHRPARRKRTCPGRS